LLGLFLELVVLPETQRPHCSAQLKRITAGSSSDNRLNLLQGRKEIAAEARGVAA
jgi:hypothetical protein